MKFNLLNDDIGLSLDNQYYTKKSQVILTSKSEKLKDLVSRANTAMQKLGGKITELNIFAHGLQANLSNSRLQRSRQSGGFGISLASGITLETYSELWPWEKQLAKNCVVRIYSCSAADQPIAKMQAGNGKLLMGYISAILKRPVLASDTTQIYGSKLGISLAGIGKHNVDFGIWEGNVFVFQPDGTSKLHSTYPNDIVRPR